MEKYRKVKMQNQEDPHLRINFHINSVPWKYKHVHDYWEVQIMLSGEVKNQVNESVYALKEGEVQILHPDDVHYMERIGKHNYDCLNLEIKKELFQSLCEGLYPESMSYLLKEKIQIPVFKLSDLMILQIQEWVVIAQQTVDIFNYTRQFYLIKILMECLSQFIESHLVVQANHKYSFSETFLKFMEKSDNISLRLHEICEKFPCNVEYVIRSFAIEGKDTPNKELRRLKLQYACGILRTTEYSIETVANMIGFGSIGHFNRLFVEEYGMLPSEYRKKYHRR